MLATKGPHLTTQLNPVAWCRKIGSSTAKFIWLQTHSLTRHDPSPAIRSFPPAAPRLASAVVFPPCLPQHWECLSSIIVVYWLGDLKEQKRNAQHLTSAPQSVKAPGQASSSPLLDKNTWWRTEDTANALSESLQICRQDENSESAWRIEAIVWKRLDAIQ